MRPGRRRHAALAACRMLEAALPPRLRGWGQAIRQEVAAIEDDSDALRFALDGLGGLLPRILLRPFAALTSGGTIEMISYRDKIRNPRVVGVACAVGAVVLGMGYLAAAGAPMRYLAINAGAFIVGLILLGLGTRAVPAFQSRPGMITLMMAAALLATALLGDQSEGAARWVRLGALSLQPSLVLLPLMLVGFARSRDLVSTLGVIAAAAALAIQPDRAMAGVLAASLAVLAILRRDRLVLAALAAGLAGFAVTLFRPDALPAVPYVDQILYSAFAVHLLAGVAVLAGAVLLVLPAMLGSVYDPANRQVHLVFGGVWLAVLLAAALGNYPTPVVGYGGSAVLGYLLSLTLLPKRAGTPLDADAAASSPAERAGGADRQPAAGATDRIAAAPA